MTFTGAVVLSLLSLLFSCGGAFAFSGKVQRVTLKEQTQVSLRIVPNLGTRLIFPFILDDPELKPPLNYKLTNAQDFAVARTLDALAGQNVFLITAHGKSGAIGKLYLSVNGYNLALNLVLSHRLSDHISDIYFDLGEDERQFLITKRVEQITEELREDYRLKLEENSRAIDMSVLGAAILYRTKRKNIKQLYAGGTDKFTNADIFLDRFLYRKPYYYVLHFWVQHFRKKVETTSMEVRTLSKDGAAKLIDGNLVCFPKDEKLDECLFATTDPTLISSKIDLKISLANAKNELFVIDY